MKTVEALEGIKDKEIARQKKYQNKMDAIAYGVQARFEENTEYVRRVTDATINVARALGVPEHEIERWACQQQMFAIHGNKRSRAISHILKKI